MILDNVLCRVTTYCIHQVVSTVPLGLVVSVFETLIDYFKWPVSFVPLRDSTIVTDRNIDTVIYAFSSTSSWDTDP